MLSTSMHRDSRCTYITHIADLSQNLSQWVTPLLDLRKLVNKDNMMTVPHTLKVAVPYVPHCTPRWSWLWHKWGLKWRKPILRWPVHHETHANICHTCLREK